MSKFLPLHSSHEKIKRAKTKFDYLKSAVNGFLNLKPYTVIKKSDATHEYIIARITKDLPEDFAWEVVEAVGHLRDALDKMMVDLADKNGRGLSGVSFPFGGLGENGKPDPFPSARLDHLKKKFTADQWDLVLAQRPYPGGNDTLWSVNEVSNANKHRKGLVQIKSFFGSEQASLGPTGFGVGFIDSLTIDPTDCDFILDDKEREKVLAAVGKGTANMQINHTVSVGVVFGDVMPVQGKNILVTLNQQIRAVESTVKIFKRTFF